MERKALMVHYLGSETKRNRCYLILSRGHRLMMDGNRLINLTGLFNFEGTNLG